MSLRKCVKEPIEHGARGGVCPVTEANSLPSGRPGIRELTWRSVESGSGLAVPFAVLRSLA